jgi:hypothetical protein
MVRCRYFGKLEPIRMERCRYFGKLEPIHPVSGSFLGAVAHSDGAMPLLR